MAVFVKAIYPEKTNGEAFHKFHFGQCNVHVRAENLVRKVSIRVRIVNDCWNP